MHRTWESRYHDFFRDRVYNFRGQHHVFVVFYLDRGVRDSPVSFGKDRILGGVFPFAPVYFSLFFLSDPFGDRSDQVAFFLLG
jgi:hypothetical protein